MKNMKIGVLMAMLTVLMLVNSVTANPGLQVTITPSPVGVQAGETVVATVHVYNTLETVTQNVRLASVTGLYPGGKASGNPVNPALWTVNTALPAPGSGGVSVGPKSTVDITLSYTIGASTSDGYYEYDVCVEGTYPSGWGSCATGTGETQVSTGSVTVVPESVIAVALIALLVPGMIYIVRKRK